MKRLLIWIMTLVIGLSGMSGALAEPLTLTFETPYFTLMLPEDWEIYDPDPEDNGSGENIWDLGFVSSPDEDYYIIEAAMQYLEDWKDTSLWDADEEQLEEYIDITMHDFEDKDGQFIDLFYAGNIPFIMLEYTSQDRGDTLYADTMTNGYVIMFYIFKTSLDTDKYYDLTEEDIAQVTRILETFRPLSPQ
ncbi:MAG: hypothetical protein IJJ23_11660 [Clostridia bacterium]|nr:hypothetical protein [Clostridia bacterium]